MKSMLRLKQSVELEILRQILRELLQKIVIYNDLPL